jgi:hypothetical protein
MPVRHPRAEQWESRLRQVFDGIDDYLEDRYGDRYPLHPARARRGETSRPEHSGLFNVGASFSAGFGSRHGPGYVVEVRMVTLSRVPQAVREQIEREVVDLLRRELPRAFPGRHLHVDRDGPVFKIYGDLGL